MACTEAASNSTNTMNIGEETLIGRVVLDTPSEEKKGWIMYEYHGNMYFLAYNRENVVGNEVLHVGDEISFRRVYDSGEHVATTVRLVQRGYTCFGIVSRLTKQCGYIERADIPKEVVFYYSDLKPFLKTLRVGDEVCFTIKGKNEKERATGITLADPGTVVIEDVSTKSVKGNILKPLTTIPTLTGLETCIPGRIMYMSLGDKKSEVYFGPRGQKRNYTLFAGDSVEFSLAIDRRNQQHRAINIVLLPECLKLTGEPRERGVIMMFRGSYGFIKCIGKEGSVYFDISEILDIDRDVSVNDEVEFTPLEAPSGFRNYRHIALRIKHLNPPIPPTTHFGYIVAIKDSFGFIETMTHNREVFFHFANYVGDLAELQIGMEVEYTIIDKYSTRTCFNADRVRQIPEGTIKMPKLRDETVYRGTVVRPLRHVDPHQEKYAGLIEALDGSDDSKQTEYEFGISSLRRKTDVLLPGTIVTFQVDVEGRAANVELVTTRIVSTVDIVKGTYGFLKHAHVPGKKLYFHISEVKNGVTISPGDKVEFTLLCNHRTGKMSACNIKKLVKSPNCEGRDLTIRVPLGPDGTKGFYNNARKPHVAGILTFDEETK